MCRSRLTKRRVVRSVLRTVGRSAWHSPVRWASHGAGRRVLPYTGPSLRSVLTLFNASYRLVEKHEKQRNAASRFKMLGTAEERQRKAEADLQRIYGQPPALVQTSAARPPGPAPTKPAPSPPDKASPVPPRAKADVMAVPLVRLSTGCWRLDWSRARPA